MKKHMNIGLFVFIGIFLFIVANGVVSLTGTQISYCEVESGWIVESDSFTGFIIRNEDVVYATDSGYISYFINDGDKTAKYANVCMLQSKLTLTNTSDGEYTFTDSDYSSVRDLMTAFKKNYSDSSYSDVYSLDYQLNNIISRMISRNNISAVDINELNGNYTLMSAAQSGIISYTYDLFENYTLTDISSDTFNYRDYERVQLSAGSYIESRTPAYKIIYDDDWQIIIQPSESVLEKLADMSTVDIVLTKDDITVTANVTIFENNGEKFVCLSLSNYMIRYYADRYIDIEIVWSNYEGLKIPVSSITTKNFYIIPVSCLVTDSSSSQSGFYIQGESGIEFVKPTIYKQDDDYCYVDCKDIDADTIIIDASDATFYQVGTLASLKGVYYINKGYAMFRLIEILYEDGDYCIINERTDYGVTLYDHILLDGSSAYENQIMTN